MIQGPYLIISGLCKIFLHWKVSLTTKHSLLRTPPILFDWIWVDNPMETCELINLQGDNSLSPLFCIVPLPVCTIAYFIIQMAGQEILIAQQKLAKIYLHIIKIERHLSQSVDTQSNQNYQTFSLNCSLFITSIGVLCICSQMIIR